MRPFRNLLIAIFLALGTWQFAQGGYIFAKAQLAQRLIAGAWETSLQTLTSTKPWSWADTWPVSRLRVPKLDVDLYVLAGDDGSSLAFGPGHRFGAVPPGEIGNCVISGHRDTHFAFLQRLKPGDEIRLQTIDGDWHVYEVVSTRIVDQSEPIRNNSDRAVLTLVTCYPFDAIVPGGPLRYVVRALTPA